MTVDSIYNPDKAKAAFEKLRKTLESKGNIPNSLDIPVEQTDTIAVQQSNSFKQSIESTLGAENVVIDVLQITDNEKGKQSLLKHVFLLKKTHDLNSTGWSPSYQDPASSEYHGS